MASLRKRNDKWQAQVRRTGHTPISKTFINRADALRWIRQTEQELDRSALAYDPSTLQRTTVADLLRRYVSDVTPAKRGHASEAKRIEVFLRYDWGNLTLARITPQVFTRYRDKRLREVEAGTVIRELGLLRTVFEVARREWDIPLHANPVASVRKPKAASGRSRRLYADEFAALLTACADGRTEWLEPGIKLAIETGMRRGELLNIRRADLDLANGLLSIPETKTDIPRTIPLSENAVVILRSLMDTATTDRLFPVSANAFRLAWERCKRRAAKDKPGIIDLRFHDLRHEAVSRFFELGLNVPEVAAISGHKDPRMLFRYTHLKPEDIVAKLRKASQQVAA
ncbi:site-specific integrase [Mesorhizobium sp. B2-1-3A]|uniref:tyrosine-type recombinase/integrase n=1 Tax=Mesorhizobium sp. B2-1-3A TaxID=2589971 RepID=UPI00112E8845|nr:site-specific integrase [Mesorhizobium sp. B2-1-3A]TPM99531.1 site-specific integrase [Mesorhizobium sp. B2-1-3A]